MSQQLCPMRLTTYINGVYYYACLDCRLPNPPYVGGQDTVPHTTGVDCSNPHDPIIIDPTQHHAAPHDVPVYTGKDAVANGVKSGITFDNDQTQILIQVGVTVDHVDGGYMLKATYNDDSTQRSVRLFDIHYKDIILRVGQELEDPDPDPSAPGDQTMTATLESASMSGDFHHRIRLNDNNRVYYVLLKKQ